MLARGSSLPVDEEGDESGLEGALGGGCVPGRFFEARESSLLVALEPSIDGALADVDGVAVWAEVRVLRDAEDGGTAHLAADLGGEDLGDDAVAEQGVPGGDAEGSRIVHRGSGRGDEGCHPERSREPRPKHDLRRGHHP